MTQQQISREEKGLQRLALHHASHTYDALSCNSKGNETARITGRTFAEKNINSRGLEQFLS
jgi:hypothetical protein